VAAVGGLVDAVAGERAGERPLGLALQPVRGEAVRVVRHRDDDVLAAPAALALQQRGEDLHHRIERAAGQVGDLHWR
jgi:hypothetical protein